MKSIKQFIKEFKEFKKYREEFKLFLMPDGDKELPKFTGINQNAEWQTEAMRTKVQIPNSELVRMGVDEARQFGECSKQHVIDKLLEMIKVNISISTSKNNFNGSVDIDGVLYVWTRRNSP